MKNWAASVITSQYPWVGAEWRCLWHYSKPRINAEHFWEALWSAWFHMYLNSCLIVVAKQNSPRSLSTKILSHDIKWLTVTYRVWLNYIFPIKLPKHFTFILSTVKIKQENFSLYVCIRTVNIDDFCLTVFRCSRKWWGPVGSVKLQFWWVIGFFQIVASPFFCIFTLENSIVWT